MRYMYLVAYSEKDDPYLSNSNKQAKGDGTNTYTKHPVNKKSTKEAEDHVWPGIP